MADGTVEMAVQTGCFDSLVWTNPQIHKSTNPQIHKRRNNTNNCYYGLTFYGVIGQSGR